MTWAVRVTDAKQMRYFDLKGREGGEQNWTNCEMTTQNTQRDGLSDFDICFRSSIYHPDRFIQTMATLLILCFEILLSLCKVLLSFSSYLLYRGIISLPGPRHRAQYLGLFVLHVGSCYLKLSGSVLCELC